MPATPYFHQPDLPPASTVKPGLASWLRSRLSLLTGSLWPGLSLRPWRLLLPRLRLLNPRLWLPLRLNPRLHLHLWLRLNPLLHLRLRLNLRLHIRVMVVAIDLPARTILLSLHLLPLP